MDRPQRLHVVRTQRGSKHGGGRQLALEPANRVAQAGNKSVKEAWQGTVAATATRNRARGALCTHPPKRLVGTARMLLASGYFSLASCWNRPLTYRRTRSRQNVFGW